MVMIDIRDYEDFGSRDPIYVLCDIYGKLHVTHIKNIRRTSIQLGKKKFKKCCSRKCWGVNKRTIKREKTCLECGEDLRFLGIGNRKFCSKSCSVKYSNKRRKRKPWSKAAREKARKTLLSKLDRITYRSKNEKKFFKLMSQKYDCLPNERMFNGFDADVVILDLKLAIEWNGVWHYKKVCKTHSLEAAQSKDKRKLKEIKKMGFNLIAIKDYQNGMTPDKAFKLVNDMIKSGVQDCTII